MLDPRVRTTYQTGGEEDNIYRNSNRKLPCWTKEETLSQMKQEITKLKVEMAENKDELLIPVEMFLSTAS
jgi:hypothetical protein